MQVIDMIDVVLVIIINQILQYTEKSFSPKVGPPEKKERFHSKSRKREPENKFKLSAWRTRREE
jgi:hypothetical protein